MELERTYLPCCFHSLTIFSEWFRWCVSVFSPLNAGKDVRSLINGNGWAKVISFRGCFSGPSWSCLPLAVFRSDSCSIFATSSAVGALLSTMIPLDVIIGNNENLSTKVCPSVLYTCLVIRAWLDVSPDSPHPRSHRRCRFSLSGVWPQSVLDGTMLSDGTNFWRLCKWIRWTFFSLDAWQLHLSRMGMRITHHSSIGQLHPLLPSFELIKNEITIYIFLWRMLDCLFRYYWSAQQFFKTYRTREVISVWNSEAACAAKRLDWVFCWTKAAGSSLEMKDGTRNRRKKKFTKIFVLPFVDHN